MKKAALSYYPGDFPISSNILIFIGRGERI